MKELEKVNMHRKVLRDSLIEAFLQDGGTLLRKDTNAKGEPVIKQKNRYDKTWRTRLTCTKIEFRDKIFSHLTRHHNKLFKSAEL